MRVSLFGLFLRRTNSLIGNVSLYNWFPIVTLLTYFMFLYAYIHGTPFLYTCICYARHLALLYVLAGVANNPGFSCPDPRVWTLVAWLELIGVRSGSSRGGQSHCHSSSSQYLSYLAPEALLLLVSTFLFFCISLHVLCTFVFSGDVTFM